MSDDPHAALRAKLAQEVADLSVAVRTGDQYIKSASGVRDIHLCRLQKAKDALAALPPPDRGALS